MALVHEDGTGKADAESLASVAAFDARCTALGDADSLDLTTTVKEQRLRKATIHMRQLYRSRWLGIRTHETQGQDWPRIINEPVDGYYIDSDEMPPDVVDACIDLARDPDIDNLNPSLTRGVVRKKIGPLETEYDRYSPQSTRRPAIDMALSPYLMGSGANARLVRA